MLQVELQNALRQIDELKARNMELEATWRELGTETQCLQSKRLQSVWWSVTQ